METHTQIFTHNRLKQETNHASVTGEGVNKPYDNIVLRYYPAIKINPTPTLAFTNLTMELSKDNQVSGVQDVGTG